ncbi:hypothetical protein FSARC_14135 [Fusarium sarcochroum]|uniref:Tail specific protease domain-containing protein n=1 Tax=Fusarium sarcochroum TaxID=1208366 RepID=A0A8H4SVM0_9HYPO|nr:hypothetical protein FSARC_14135 [Fusarium sarcochroum]
MKYTTVIALALGVAASPIDPWESMPHARDPIDAPFRRSQKNTPPCKIIADAYTAADPEPGKPVFLVKVPPSVGIACLKSVPVDKKRNKALLEYLFRFVSFHSTIDILADPPEEYLVPGVDILGGWDNITAKLGKDLYESQYDFMFDLRSLYVAAADGHFAYTPAILNTLSFGRPAFEFESLSLNGVSLPQLFMRSDVTRGNHNELDYHPSAVDTIDGVPAVEFLEQEAALALAKPHDPDAQYNNMFSSLPKSALGRVAGTRSSQVEIPDNHTIQFYNGSKKVTTSYISIPPGINFTGIDSGEKFHEAFEVPAPPQTKSVEPTSVKTSATPATSTASSTTSPTALSPSGYPTPIAKVPQDSLAAYFLNSTDYEDVVVLSILDFLPLKSDAANIDGTGIRAFLLDVQKFLIKIVKKAKQEGRDKLVIDLSANGGGSKVLASLLYTLFFPGAELNLVDRYRANEALEAAVAANWTLVKQALLVGNNDLLDAEGKHISSGSAWFGPHTVAGQNVTEAFTSNYSKPISFEPEQYYNGYDPSGKTVFSEPPFKPENILIVTDGVCASSCTIFTGLMARNQGVRTLALGGRPQKQAMQAMGGTKGTKLALNANLAEDFDIYVGEIDNSTSLKILEDAWDSIPTIEDPPLLPLLKGTGGINGYNGYTTDRLDDYPIQFRYEAANCRLFYTQRMTRNVTEVWRMAADVAWKEGTCVEGSSTGQDGRIGDKALKFDPKVKSRVPAIKGPGSLE